MAKKEEKKVKQAPKMIIKNSQDIKASGTGGGASSSDFQNVPGGGAGGGSVSEKKFKVSKLMLWPSRKINLGNYSSVDLNAGIEIVFDTPVDIDSIDITQAQAQMRTVIRKEFKEQYAPYMKKKEAK